MRQPQQILHRVLVLITRHAPERRVPLLAAPHLRGNLNFTGQPANNPHLLRIRQLHLGILRWHLAIADHVEHLQPPADILPLQ